MNEMFKQKYVVDCHTFEDFILSKLGLPEHGERWGGKLPEEISKKIEIVEDILYGWIIEIYGNETFMDCDEDTFYYHDGDCCVGEPGDEDYSLRIELSKQISELIEKLMADGTIPKEFIMKVWW